MYRPPVVVGHTDSGHVGELHTPAALLAEHLSTGVEDGVGVAAQEQSLGIGVGVCDGR